MLPTKRLSLARCVVPKYTKTCKALQERCRLKCCQKNKAFQDSSAKKDFDYGWHGSDPCEVPYCAAFIFFKSSARNWATSLKRAMFSGLAAIRVRWASRQVWVTCSWLGAAG